MKKELHVHILNCFKNLPVFYGTELIFRTLCAGFPTETVTVTDNAGFPAQGKLMLTLHAHAKNGNLDALKGTPKYIDEQWWDIHQLTAMQ